MKNNLVRVLVVIGCSVLTCAAGRIVYVKGKIDAYKEITKELKQVCDESRARLELVKKEFEKES